MGDANASIPTPQPVIYRNMFGSFGKAVKSTCMTFVSKLSVESGILDELRLEKLVVPVGDCRKITKKSMVMNDATPEIEVDPETYEVKVDGEHITCQPMDKLSLAQRYFLF